MRILLVHRHFWPDTPPYAEMLRVIAARLAVDGHTVRVLSAQPSYTSTVAGSRRPRTERVDGFEVRRLWMFAESKRNYLARGLNTLLLVAGILRQAFARGGWDAVMISTMPPVLPGAAARLCARLRGARFLYHMMDIHPEALAYAGLVRKGLAYRLLRALDARTCRKADHVLVLSDDMRRTLAERNVPTGHVRIVDNFELRGASGDPSEPGPERGDGSPDSAERFTVLFAGNIGRFQALDGLVSAARLLAHRDDLRFLFVGEGAGLPRLRALAEGLPEGLVEFRGHVPVEEARAAMRQADLGVVALAPGIHRVAFPSKTMTYACSGLPMLALVEEESSLARLVRDQALGEVAPVDDAECIAARIQQMVEMPEEQRRTQRSRILRLGESRYSRSVAEERWSELFADLAASAPQEPSAVAR